MNLQEAKDLLNTCTRTELRDHAFGDVEVTWTDKVHSFVAEGYFGGSNSMVSVQESPENWTEFEDSEADELRKCGEAGHIERNDETGPDEYSEGTTMPGLTKEGVLQELTGE